MGIIIVVVALAVISIWFYNKAKENNMKGWSWALKFLLTYFLSVFISQFIIFLIIRQFVEIEYFKSNLINILVSLASIVIAIISCSILLNKFLKRVEKKQIDDRISNEANKVKRIGWKGNSILLNISDDLSKITNKDSMLSNRSSFIIDINSNKLHYTKYYSDEILITDKKINIYKKESLFQFNLIGNIVNENLIEAKSFCQMLCMTYPLIFLCCLFYKLSVLKNSAFQYKANLFITS